MLLKTAACCGFWAVLKLANYALPYRTPRVAEGIPYEQLAKLAVICGMTGENDTELAETFICWAGKESNPLDPVPVVWEK